MVISITPLAFLRNILKKLLGIVQFTNLGQSQRAWVCVDKVETQRNILFKQAPKKAAICACKVGVSKSTPKSVSCAAKETPIKASLESVIASPTILKKPNTPRLPAIGTTFIKKFKGKDLMIEVKEDGLYCEGKCYKSLSGLAMAITEYPISGYVFFYKEIAEWAAKITKRKYVAPAG